MASRATPSKAALRLLVPAADLAPRKSAAVQLDAAMHPARAFGAIAAAGLFQLSANAPGVLTSNNPEFIHQMRVALRRLRSALHLFGAYLPQDLIQEGSAELQWLTQLLGQARDHDVLITQTLPRALRTPTARRAGATEHALGAALAPRRAACLAAVRKALRSRRYRALLHRLAEAVRLLQQHQTVGVGGKANLRDFASRKLRQSGKKLRVTPRGLAALSSGERHHFRIAAKRLRYAVEFFSPLFKAGPARRYARPLADLQDALGMLNDHAVALNLLSDLRVAPHHLLAAQTHLHEEDRKWLAQAVAAQRRLLRAQPFWD
jgi:CHAD domain-containing protein